MIVGAEHFADVRHPLWEALLASPSASVAWSAGLVRDAVAALRPPQCVLGVLGRHQDLPEPPAAPSSEVTAGSALSGLIPDLPPPPAASPLAAPSELPAYLRRARGEDV